MRHLLTFSLALFAFLALSAQQESSASAKVPGQTSFYAELGGAGILFSANVDRRFKKSNLGWGWRAGVGFVSYYDGGDYVSTPSGGYYTNGDGDVSVLTVPVQINHVFGKPNSPHTFEAGVGVTVAGRKIEALNFYDDKRSSVFGTASFMYRRQPANGGFSWRVGFTPVVARGYIQPFGAVSVGYNF